MPRRIWSCISGVVVGLLLLSGVVFLQTAQASERVALVIGNAAYDHAMPLNNPPNDAREIAAALGRVGFQVTRVDDADIRQLTRALAAFRQQSRTADLAVFYYAGHAIQVEGRNYLVPVDAEVLELGDVGLSLVPFGTALQQLQGEVNIIILDACRDNPFARELDRSAARLGRTLGSMRGLGRAEALLGGGTYLMMAAAPDAVALDGPPGGNSPFTAALLEFVEVPGLELSQLHRQVRRLVEQRTEGAQSPEAIDRLPPRPVYLAGTSVEPTEESPPPSPPPPISPEALELAFWQSIQASREVGDFQAYLEQYPAGSFATLARARIAALQTAEPPSDPEPPEQPSLVRLSVKATPADARIRIMNIVPAYEDGIALDPGRYDIEVSASGYETHRRWVELAAGDRVVEVELERVPDTPRVESTPAPVAGGSASSTSSAEARPATGTVHRDRLRDGTEGPEMVFIRGGTFLMGSPESEAGRNAASERPHQVRVEDVWIGRYAVTFEEYRRFMLATGQRRAPTDFGWGRGRRPVINVSWHDAIAYAEWLSQQTGQQYRLPTEAEWEFAARAGMTTARYWGDDIGRNQANCRGCGSRWDGRRTAPVGSFAPNPWGLYDMLGNVWEWTCSVFDASYGGAEQRCAASGERRAVRGGSYNERPDGVRSAARDYGPVRVRSANRYGSTPGIRNTFQGFRLARSP